MEEEHVAVEAAYMFLHRRRSARCYEEPLGGMEGVHVQCEFW